MWTNHAYDAAQERSHSVHEHWGWCAQPCVALKVNVRKENNVDPDGSAVLLCVYTQKTQAGAISCSRYK